MANQNKGLSSQRPVSKPAENKEFTADDYFLLYDQTVQQPSARIPHLIAIPLLLFGLFGLLWAIPFPHLRFLGTYNGFFNWASFLLAIMIYIYLRLSPMVSYLLLFFLLICAYGAVQLSAWQVLGGPPLWLVCGILLFVSALIITFSGSRSNVRSKGKLVVAAPLWFTYKITNKKTGNL